MSASPSIPLCSSEVRAWREGFLSLKPGVSPCPGLARAKWVAVHTAALAFLDRLADDASALGWTTAQLFGAHPQLGVIRSDHCGALVLSGETVTAVEPDRIVFERTHYRRSLPGQPSDSVPIWSFRD
jgi:hypothetical protein